MTALLTNYKAVIDEITLQVKLSGNNMPEILLVSKKQSEEKILPLLECGHRLFGENQIQEASDKWLKLKKYIL